MENKRDQRQRRARRTRATIKRLHVARLAINRSLNHTYAQLISPCGSKILASASTLDKELQGQLKHGGNQDAARQVGKLIASRAQQAGISQVAFDRSGYKYHGRVKALADAAREAGLQF